MRFQWVLLRRLFPAPARRVNFIVSGGLNLPYGFRPGRLPHTQIGGRHITGTESLIEYIPACAIFEEQFANWLQSSLDTVIPREVRGFSFNLFEPAAIPGVKFGIELIGARAFDKDNEDWACEEVWEPSHRQLPIPVEFSGDTWEVCLDRMKKLVVRYLDSDSSAAKKLKAAQGIGTGFVDGSLEIVWML